MKMGTTRSPFPCDAAARRAPIRKFSTPCDIVLRSLGRLRLVYGLDAIENLAQIALRDLNVIVVL